MKDLTVFIITHNRPQLVQIAIESVLNQKPFDFSFVVSDNSDNNETEELLSKKDYFEKINYYHTTANGADRWHDIFSRVNTKYFMVFHDDDEMYSSMIDDMYSLINESNYAAIGCNADIYVNNVFSKRFYNKKKNISFLKKSDLGKQWLNSNCVPFPSYIYHKDCMKVFPWNFPAGKNSDSVFIGNIVKYVGPACWYAKPSMIYNVHQSQDSAVWDYYSIYGMYNYFCKDFSKAKKRKKMTAVLYSFLSHRYNSQKQIMKYGEKILLKNSIYLYLRLKLKYFYWWKIKN